MQSLPFFVTRHKLVCKWWTILGFLTIPSALLSIKLRVEKKNAQFVFHLKLII